MRRKMFNSDKPIKSSEQDILGRKYFAEAVATAICKDTNKDSHVISLYGTWGSGKTSVINMVLEYIVNKTEHMENDEKPIIIKFNPWLFADQHQLVNQFFNQFSNAMDIENNSKWLKDSAKLLKTFSKLVTPLSAVPGINTFAFASSTASSIVSDAADSLGNHLEKDLQGIKDEIHSLLDLNEQRIVIVIDDIDRLNEKEIRQIFQLVKSLADFPYTTYILTFDRHIVSKALAIEQAGDGKHYLEKIIQIPFELPGISNSDFESLLFNKLNDVFKCNQYDDFDKVHWGNIYHTGFKYFFKNIRDINRFMNVFVFSYEIIKHEVNIIDFAAITAIQVFLPEVYHEIKNNKQVFAGILLPSNTSRKGTYKTICDNTMKKGSDNAQQFLDDFLSELFPKITSYYKDTVHSDEALYAWKKSRRICADDMFDIYFRLALPSGKVSQLELNIFFSPEMNDVAKIADLLLYFKDKGQVLDLLDTLTYSIEKVPHENIKLFVVAILDVGDLFQEEDKNMFCGTEMKIYWLISSLLNKIKTQDERFEILKSAIESSSQSVYTIVWLIDFQDSIHNKEMIQSPGNIRNEQLVSQEHLQKLKQLACQKIDQLVKEGKLVHLPKIHTVLTLWKKWNNEDMS